MSIKQEVVVTHGGVDLQGVEIAQEVVVTQHTPEREIVSIGGQGPRGSQGPIGPPGGGVAFERTSGEVISALRVVWEDDAGIILPIDYRDEAHIDLIAGVTITAAAAPGLPIAVQRAGVLDISGLGLPPGRVWLGANGALTTNAPTDGFDVLVGYALSSTRLIVAFSDHIELPE